MAYYAALVSVVQLLDEISHRDRYPIFLAGEQQIMKSLRENCRLLLDLLEDYSSKGDDAADCLERRITDAAYQAQDIIESSQIDSEHIKSYGSTSDSFEKIISIEWGAYVDLMEVQEKVDSIVEEVISINESYRTEALQLDYYSADIGASQEAPTDRNTTVGLDEHMVTIKDKLCGVSSKLHIIPIVGMGGIGKTTLARNVFDDNLIVYHFYIRIWVTVSQDYHLQKVLLSIRDSINKITKEFISEVNEEKLKERIYRYLKGRRYLIVMDDIWSTQVLDDLKMILPDDCNGSRLMLTTRLSDVADTFGTLHQMNFLDDEQSWNLLRDKVFAQEHCLPELEVIGKLIAKNCRGLPLAVVVVAGLLYKVNRTPCDWKEIAGNVSSVVTEIGDHFSKILSLSYNHLPHHLKACFLYIGGFPEAYEISVSKLTKLWIAEGFLKPVESKSLEEVAEEYLEDLVKRSLVLVTKKGANGKFKFCSIHDLLRDLCSQRAQMENFFHVIGENDYFNLQGRENKRRLYLHYSNWSSIKLKDMGSHVRSILCCQYTITPGRLLLYVLGFRLLRVFDALQVGLLSFPVEIVKLFHLRYLAFLLMQSTFDHIRLPPSIYKLHNLQTLIIDSGNIFGGPCDISLPSEIWNMPQLRHVMINGRVSLSPIPFAARLVGEVPVLKNLQTLSRIANLSFTTEILEMIPNLKKLKVFYDRAGFIVDWEQYCLNNLVRLRQLEELSIRFYSRDSRQVFSLSPRSFAFPLSLKKLSLCGSGVTWKFMTAVGSLPNLQVLKLGHYSLMGDKWEPIEGEFPQLKFLLMASLDLKYWEAENTHFPSLEHLKIVSCRRLKEIPPGIGEIPTLELIEVYHSKLAADSAMQVQEEQRNLGNDVLQVRVYDSDAMYSVMIRQKLGGADLTLGEYHVPLSE